MLQRGNHFLMHFTSVLVPPIADHSRFLQTHLCSTCAPQVTLLLRTLLGLCHLGMSSSTKPCIADILILWVFLVHDPVFQVHALGKVSPCGPFGSIPWGIVLGIIALPAGHAGCSHGKNSLNVTLWSIAESHRYAGHPASLFSLDSPHALGFAGLRTRHVPFAELDLEAFSDGLLPVLPLQG